MIIGNVIWGAPDWLLPGMAMLIGMVAVVVWTYLRTPTSGGIRWMAGSLKLIAIVALIICLLDPLLSGERPRPGANLFTVLVDTSESMEVRDRGSRDSRGAALKLKLVEGQEWRTRLAQDFDLRWYAFDGRMRPVLETESIEFSGRRSVVYNALEVVAQRFQKRPLAGVLLMSDGNATDIDGGLDWSLLPPVYPIVFGRHRAARDLRIDAVTTTVTNFETAPVTVRGEVVGIGFKGRAALVELVDEHGTVLKFKEVTVADDGRPLAIRFRVKPEEGGVHFFQLRVRAKNRPEAFTDGEKSDEATMANNARWVTVDRAHGPYDVLYVGGRPNWEYKFLRRALKEDPEVHLVGLLRIARREPKFDFRSHEDERTNPLYRGFGKENEDVREQYDEPVLLKLGIRDAGELREGFPKAADLLFRYHAVILDDVEAEFFSRDQMSLLQQFVSQRGGGLLMLGGQETFSEGQYRHTPFAELLPVYVDPLPKQSEIKPFRLDVTREGWLQPWVRLRPTEAEERRRLAEMPPFLTRNRIGGLKPGATALLNVLYEDGQTQPALATQRYGNGRTAALTVGDLWRWGLARPEGEQRDDLGVAWRQMLRWLVSDVPQRVDAQVIRDEASNADGVKIRIQVRDEEFKPLDNAKVIAKLSGPDDITLELTGAPGAEPGVYLAKYAPRKPGVYRARIEVEGPDGNPVGKREIGWTAEPHLDEFQQLEANRQRLQMIADKTGGEIVELDRLDSFVRELPTKKIPVTEPWTRPLWHHWGMLAFVVVCLTGEWGLRRIRGLP